MSNYPEVGKTYEVGINKRKVIDIITDKSGVDIIIYTKNGHPRVNRTSSKVFIQSYMSNSIKPLDQAFKQLDKQMCSHRNIREDRFFSAMVYKTCKDCGKPLN